MTGGASDDNIEYASGAGGLNLMRGRRTNSKAYVRP
jgi:hypothetical protein